jgi:hypothetical protein
MNDRTDSHLVLLTLKEVYEMLKKVKQKNKTRNVTRTLLKLVKAGEVQAFWDAEKGDIVYDVKK